jgi:hypothetical protein
METYGTHGHSKRDIGIGLMHEPVEDEPVETLSICPVTLYLQREREVLVCGIGLHSGERLRSDNLIAVDSLTLNMGD